MKLYNTLTKTVEQFVSHEDKKVKLFVCGPTVYDFSHLGHAKTYTQLDVLARTLRQLGYDVTYLQNITDLDDKIIIRASEQGIGWEKLRTRFEAAYYEDMAALQNTSVTTYARATDHIDDIVGQVQTLLDKKHAYIIDDDGVYFEIATFPEYGKLSGRSEIKENDAQTRIDQSDQKRGWNDFCLWKFSKPGEPIWDAPFGKGRPGWHIEDTAITEHFFGPQYDIHGGAVDLIFPHHEAEITQMEAASGKSPFVTYWVHTGFLTIDNAKMSKSLGNFFTIRDVLGKGVDGMAIRLFMLQSHYRSAISFSWENLDAAKNRLEAYRAMADQRWQTQDNGKIGAKELEKAKNAILEALANDLDTPQALTVLSQIETTIDSGGISTASQEAYTTFLGWLDETLGLRLGKTTDITDGQKQLLVERHTARTTKNWAKSDQLRDQLKTHGLAVRDTNQHQIWHRL